MRLRNKVTIVTGGAQGIGHAIAFRLAKEGAKVVIADIEEKGAQAAAKIKQKISRAEVAFHQVDVSEEEGVKGLVESTVQKFGGLDIIVNNAWRWPDKQMTHETITSEAWEYGFRLAMSATLWSAKYGAVHIRPGGSIISIASVHGMQVGYDWLPYDPMKAGLLQLVKSLAVELGPKQIRVNAISTGLIITQDNKKKFDKSALWFQNQMYPLGRLGRDKEVAGAAFFLASNDASFVTGHNLVVDGGLTIQLVDNVMSRMRVER